MSHNGNNQWNEVTGVDKKEIDKRNDKTRYSGPDLFIL